MAARGGKERMEMREGRRLPRRGTSPGCADGSAPAGPHACGGRGWSPGGWLRAAGSASAAPPEPANRGGGGSGGTAGGSRASGLGGSAGSGATRDVIIF